MKKLLCLILLLGVFVVNSFLFMPQPAFAEVGEFYTAKQQAQVETRELIDFDEAEIRPGTVSGTLVLIVNGTKPASMRVNLEPLVYVRQPEYWGIEVVGYLPDIRLPAIVPYSVSIPLEGIQGTKGVEVIGATRSKLLSFDNQDTEQSQQLKINRDLWNQQNLSNYRYTLTNSCFCISEARGPVVIEVRNGKMTSITNAATNQPANPELFQKYDTIPKLFDLIGDAIAKEVDSLTVEYNPTLGYPTQINIDFSSQIADEELFLTIENLQKD
jgi:hypothetical protein